MNGFKKVIIVAGLTMAMMADSANAERLILSNNFPHYWEFDASVNENPNHNWWCGHAALKMVLKYKKGVAPTMKQLDANFRANSPGGYAMNRCPDQGQNGTWCASLYDIFTAAKVNYGITTAKNNTVTKTVAGSPNYAGVLSKIKSIIKSGSPVVSIAAYQGNWEIGHTWVIIGYNDNGNPNAPGDAYLFLRDDSQQYPTNPEMDDWITVRDYVSMMNAISKTTKVPHNPNSYFEFVSF